MTKAKGTSGIHTMEFRKKIAFGFVASESGAVQCGVCTKSFKNRFGFLMHFMARHEEMLPTLSGR